MITYEVGDAVTYETFMGNRRTIKVESKEADIKNGIPGFEGRDDLGCLMWGYDYQILEVAPA
jgi:hypothetical protein